MYLCTAVQVHFNSVQMHLKLSRNGHSTNNNLAQYKCIYNRKTRRVQSTDAIDSVIVAKASRVEMHWKAGVLGMNQKPDTGIPCQGGGGDHHFTHHHHHPHHHPLHHHHHPMPRGWGGVGETLLQTWNLSKILHRRIFRLKFLHRQFHLISTVLIKKKHKKLVKMEKFTPLATNFTLPPALTGWTNSTSAPLLSASHSSSTLVLLSPRSINISVIVIIVVVIMNC